MEVRKVPKYEHALKLWYGLLSLIALHGYAKGITQTNGSPVTGYTRRVIAYDTKASRFIKCASLKERRMHHSATVLENKLYITGGRFINSRDVVEDSDNFDCFDPKTDWWRSEGALPCKLFDHGSLTLTHVSQTWAKS